MCNAVELESWPSQINFWTPETPTMTKAKIKKCANDNNSSPTTVITDTLCLILQLASSVEQKMLPRNKIGYFLKTFLIYFQPNMISHYLDPQQCVFSYNPPPIPITIEHNLHVYHVLHVWYY